MELLTARLCIRPFLPKDVTPGYLGWLNDPVVTRYSNQRFRHHNLESCINYQRSFAASDNSFLLIQHLEDSVAIGTMTVYRNTDHGTADIGLMIGNRNYWRQGLGLEAWRGVVEYITKEPKIRKVTGGTARPNTGMTRIMEESGMKLEATRHQHELIEGEAVDLLYYALFSRNLA